MSKSFVVLSAALLVLTAIVHSTLGERRLLKPLLAHASGILASSLARFVLRFAWHLTSLSWLVLASILLTLGFQPEHALAGALAATGVAFTTAGIFDAIGSRGRHVGWPLLTAIGVASLLAAATAG
jgi:hypothetical protein